jgi:hypothetical protein
MSISQIAGALVALIGIGIGVYFVMEQNQREECAAEMRYESQYGKISPFDKSYYVNKSPCRGLR